MLRCSPHGDGQGLVSGCDAANLLLVFSAGAPKRLRLFPEQTDGGQELPSEKDANGGIRYLFLG